MGFAPNWLRGCATALVTPMHANGSMDRGALRRIVDHQVAGGVNVLVPVGTTGESATSTAEEDAETLLAAMRAHPLGGGAVRIGTVLEDAHGFVQMQTRFGGRRVVDWLSGEQLPRIC